MVSKGVSLEAKAADLPSPPCLLPVRTEGNSCSSSAHVVCYCVRCVLIFPLWAATIVSHPFAAETRGSCEEQMRSCVALPEVMQEAGGVMVSLTLAVRYSG